MSHHFPPTCNTEKTTKPAATVCPKCSTNPDGSLGSCCSRGGAWHGKCGDIIGGDILHTWVDGFLTCESESSELHTAPGTASYSSDVIPQTSPVSVPDFSSNTGVNDVTDSKTYTTFSGLIASVIVSFTFFIM